ncbi:Pentatricopeptide repeat [Dillenia turbinata]|uniref:Pentatricopeptide repeat n=1 Tax=Dillenia turbinata TaxID=194707 RepID=A0AAN8VU34_9MAGN
MGSIDMYAKCGSLDRSLVVFFKLQEKSPFCWNSIIEALASHGLADEALAMFTRMESEKVKPDTFVILVPALMQDYIGIDSMYGDRTKFIHLGRHVRWLQLHKNLEIAQLVVNKLLELESNNSGYNTFAQHFVAADESHGVSDEIYYLLRELNWQLKLANYAPELGLQ